LIKKFKNIKPDLFKIQQQLQQQQQLQEQQQHFFCKQIIEVPCTFLISSF